MKYMVMECHPGYAVVLDENGRFSKVANMRYEVGQTVTEVVEMAVPQGAPAKKKNVKWLYSLAAVAACLLLILVPSLILPNMTYASVYMTINPEVRIDVNRSDMVVGLEGINADGEVLIEGYSYQKKDLDLVMDELVDYAIHMGFLHEGGKITLALDAEDDEWVGSHKDAIEKHLHSHLKEHLTVNIEITGCGTEHNDDHGDNQDDDHRNDSDENHRDKHNGDSDDEHYDDRDEDPDDTDHLDDDPDEGHSDRYNHRPAEDQRNDDPEENDDTDDSGDDQGPDDADTDDLDDGDLETGPEDDTDDSSADLDEDQGEMEEEES